MRNAAGLSLDIGNENVELHRFIVIICNMLDVI